MTDRLRSRDHVRIIGGKFKGRSAMVLEHRTMLLADIEGIGIRWIKVESVERIG